ncbi:MAG: hypothetical protein P9L94_01085 [Candidatus Hinthialibacter antarcticus]|nr:hypothetical protein [Candidatus Hinthialibacter antarcticus]
MSLSYKIIIVFFAFSLVGHSQTIELQTNLPTQLVKKVDFLSDTKADSASSDLDIKTYFDVKRGSSCINRDGSIFVNNGRIVELKSKGNEVTKISDGKFYDFGSPALDSDGKLLAYIRQEGNYGLIEFYDVENKKNVATYTHYRVDEARLLNHLVMSGDGSVFAYSLFEPGIDPTGHHIYVVEKNSNSFSPTLIGQVEGLKSKMWINQQGNRIFYKAATRVNRALRTDVFMVEKKEDQWLPPARLSLPAKSGSALEPDIYDINLQGDQILVWTDSYGLAIVNELKGKWSEIDYIGYTPKLRDRARMTPDGMMVIVQSDHTKDVRDYEECDLLKFVKNGEKWNNEKLNPDGLKMFGDFLLSKDGNHLLWTPQSE